MSKGIFQYSVLKYRHSYLLNEVVNIGLLLYFPEENHIKFLFPKRLNRISGLYTDFDLSTIKTVQSIFENTCRDLHFDWAKYINSLLQDVNKLSLEALIPTYFIAEDASSIYFDRVKTGVNIGIDLIATHYYDEYFSCYEEYLHQPAKKDEKYLEHNLKTKLKTRLKTFHNIDIEVNKEISVGLISERFKLGWENGSENLITPIAFDLVEKESIKQKSLSWFGKLSFLGGYAKNNNISFHVITSRPTDKSLQRDYENAIKIIKTAPAPTTVYEDNQLDEYANYIIKYLDEKGEKAVEA